MNTVIESQQQLRSFFKLAGFVIYAPSILRFKACGFPPKTSTFPIVVYFFRPCRPFRLVDTFTLIGSNVIWPILVLETARELPTSRNSMTVESVSSVSVTQIKFVSELTDQCYDTGTH